ncbi:ABC transporter substrate-binding protein [Aromatoleum aromaticum]|uniref:ABC transporter substrate-binding protein n=1 Tax=Aromatoleum aromaticum (strain DSM 19018 / LMG 30748 / EbN1) TaxID=76114 RepID=Q5P350_AROAE|nr:ABC transporter substrate binding protein [Aromatoleum aromaticum]NMG53505.1 hypothetical protein [Aromatoleum aromaticum]CAI08264.1 conserved hypothetical protein [Aromatoleum aromaticum EbN1]
MPRGPRVFLATLLFLAATLGRGEAVAAAAVLFVSSERSGAYEETIAAISAALAPDVAAADIAVVETQDVSPGAIADSRIIVTVGAEAAQAVAEQAPRQPVLHTLLPRESFENLPAPAPEAGRRSAVFLDQPVQRQIALLAEALPEWRQLALLAGPRSQHLAARLATAAREQQMVVTIENIVSDREIYPALERLLAERAILLALPDRVVFNSYTIQNILLTSYRHRSPLIGFSPAYVRAGALLGLFSTPAQISAQAAEAIRAVLAGGALPPPQPPRQFEVGINQNVARALGITIEPAEDIAARMIRRDARQ